MQLALDLTQPRIDRMAAMAAALTAGNLAIERGAEKATRIDPTFIEAASKQMLAYLAQHGTSSGELMTDACKLAGIKSTDDRHFGVVFRMLIKRGLIRWAGECRRVRGHGSRGGSRYTLVRA